MDLKIWTLTTDGDNIPVETEVFASEDAARAALIVGLENLGHRRGIDGHKLSAASTPELCQLWEETAEGVCILEEHTIEISQLNS